MVIRGYSYSWNGPVWEDLCIMLGNPPDFPKEQDMLTFIKLVGNIMWTKSKQLETLSKCHGGHQQTVFGQYCILWRNKKCIEIHIWSRPFPNILWSHIFSTAPNKPTAAALQPITLKGVRPGSHGSPSRSSFTIGLRRNVHGMNALLPSLSSTPETKQDCYVNPYEILIDEHCWPQCMLPFEEKWVGAEKRISMAILSLGRQWLPSLAKTVLGACLTFLRRNPPQSTSHVRCFFPEM